VLKTWGLLNINIKLTLARIILNTNANANDTFNFANSSMSLDLRNRSVGNDTYNAILFSNAGGTGGVVKYKFANKATGVGNFHICPSDGAFGTPMLNRFVVQGATGFVGIGTSASSAQLHAVAGAATTIGQIIQGAAAQSANLLSFRNSAAATLSAFKFDASWQPPQIADSAASNDSVYYSTTAGKLVYKDGAGVVKNLY